MKIQIRNAVKEDCARMMELIRELALYERAPEEVTVDFNHFVEITQSKGANGRAPVTEEIVRKMIVSGLLDSLFDSKFSLVEKLDLFENLLAKIKNRKKEPVPEKYIGLGSRKIFD